MNDLGISEGRLAAIEQRLENLPHSQWKAAGCDVVRSSLRREGDPVATCERDEVAQFIAHASDDVAVLVQELVILREQKRLIGDERDQMRGRSLSDRIEMQKWKDKFLSTRRAWRDFKEAIE